MNRRTNITGREDIPTILCGWLRAVFSRVVVITVMLVALELFATYGAVVSYRCGYARSQMMLNVVISVLATMLVSTWSGELMYGGSNE